MKRKVLILGAGGHGQMAADILLAASLAGADDTPAGFLDDDAHLLGSVVLGLLVLGAIADLGRLDPDAVVVAIGDNRTRRRIALALRAQGTALASVIHPRAVISPDVTIGLGVFVAAGVIVNTGSSLADGVILSTGCTLGHHNRVGDYAHIGPGAHLGGHVRVGEGSMIGVGVSAIPGRSIGAWSVVGAGAAVVDDIPPHCLAVGVPARVVRRAQEDLETARLLPMGPLGDPARLAAQAAASGVQPEWASQPHPRNSPLRPKIPCEE